MARGKKAFAGKHAQEGLRQVRSNRRMSSRTVCGAMERGFHSGLPKACLPTRSVGFPAAACLPTRSVGFLAKAFPPTRSVGFHAEGVS